MFTLGYHIECSREILHSLNMDEYSMIPSAAQFWHCNILERHLLSSDDLFPKLSIELNGFVYAYTILYSCVSSYDISCVPRICIGHILEHIFGIR